MRKLTVLLTLLVAPFLSNSVFAHNTGEHACKKVWEACKTAGKKKKDLVACVKTIKSGGNVDGVQVDPEAAKNCQAQKK